MTVHGVAHDFLRLLDHVAGGSAEATLNGSPFATVDGDTRDLTVQIGLFTGPGRASPPLLRERHLRMWEIRGVPSALARSGWSVSFRDGPREILRIGRTASALTGHVHLNPAALGRLRKLI